MFEEPIEQDPDEERRQEQNKQQVIMTLTQEDWEVSILCNLLSIVHQNSEHVQLPIILILNFLHRIL